MAIKDLIDKLPFKKRESYVTRMLIMRFSAMGDVAITIPVIHSLASQHRELRITVLAPSRFTPMFEWLPANVDVKGINIDAYDGVTGAAKLYSRLSEMDFDVVADLQDSLLTKYVRTRFKLQGAKTAVIDKGSKEKKEFGGDGASAKSLRPMAERYADVFRDAGYTVDIEFHKAFNPLTENFRDVRAFAGKKGEGEKWIGIAPFAAYKQKIYPLDKMLTVAEMLARKGYKVFLFGAGKEETKELQSWEDDGIVSVCGKLGGLHNELLLMTQLDTMISMDSANMHLASLVGTRVVSIWGATHPKAGFLGYGQSLDDCIQADVDCRPCSVYGNKKCRYGDMRCFRNIKPETIVKAVMKKL